MKPVVREKVTLGLGTMFKGSLVYLFTCSVVPHGPGRASQGTSGPDGLALISALSSVRCLGTGYLFTCV